MKTIGLIGGMSWESSASYYRLVNEGVRARLGGLHSARTLMYSVDFADIEVLQREARWEEAGGVLAQAARRLEAGGAELLVLCTNTMHRVAAAIEAAVAIPLVHIADATAARIRARSLETVGLLGTRFTMEEAFYKDRLAERHGLKVLVPDAEERQRVHGVIYDELCQGEVRPGSKAEYVRIMETMAAAGAQGIILGCTEIGLLVGEGDARVPLFDTARIHAEAAVDLALA
ncbi:MAG TPA: aspartate/glutamate racemase family protein [Vicinamibacteria bacterium]